MNNWFETLIKSAEFNELLGYSLIGFDNLLVGEEVVDKSDTEAVRTLGYFDTEEMAKNIQSLTCLFLWSSEVLMLVSDLSNRIDGVECSKRVGVFATFREV